LDQSRSCSTLAETLEESDYTSAQRRIESLQSPDKHSDRFLAPITIDELRDELGARPSSSGYRCSDNGFLNMSSEDYLALLDWTAPFFSFSLSKSVGQ
jgi:hypothetical protein